MRRLAWGPGLAIALALAGCAPEAEGNETGLCTTVCRCLGGLPGQQRECVAECVGDSDVRQVSNACVECVFVNSNMCTDLIQDCFLDGPCAQPTRIPPGAATAPPTPASVPMRSRRRILSMRYWTPALALIIAASGTASAQQPQPQPQPPPPPVADPQPNPNPDPNPTPVTPPNPTPPNPMPPNPTPMPPMPREDAQAYRPTELSLAIGFGYALPTSLQTPNIASVRLRLPSGLTFEPQIVLASSSHDVDTGPSMKDEASEVGVGALGRLPVVKHGRVDLEVLGGLNINQASTKPDVDDSDVTITTFSAVYGFAVTTWINRHWQVSLSALNPIITSVKRDEEMGPGTSTVTTDQTVGLIFDPRVTVMLHLYH